MSGQPSVWRRAQRREAIRQRAEVFALAHRYAAVLGWGPADLLAEA